MILDDCLAKCESDLFLIFGDSQIEDVDTFVLGRHVPALNEFKRSVIINANFSMICHDVCMHRCKVNSFSTLKVLSINCNFEIVIGTSREDLETWLVSFVCYAKSYSCTEHGLRALHKVVHDVLKVGHESFFVNQIKVNFFICRHLDPDVSFDEIDLTYDFIQLSELIPFTCLLVDLEEQD